VRTMLVEVPMGRGYPSPDLSVPTETPPAVEAGAPRKRWPLVAIAATAVVAVAVVLFFVLKGGGKEATPSSSTPEFSFKVVKAKAIPTKNHGDKGALASVAQKSASDIHEVLDRMYSLAFLDPNNWKSGSYDAVFGFFDLGQAQERAQTDADALTLGATAGQRFNDVQPTGGTLSVQVLIDQSGHPVSATASVVFRARATGTGTSGEIVVSEGQYFMHILEGGWSIFAYSVDRDDRPFTVKATPSGGSS
jgi:hypothetical protein